MNKSQLIEELSKRVGNDKEEIRYILEELNNIILENTNCVIAGHRGGYHGEQLFKNIENLAIGDEIRITNPWETLTYFVIKKIVIEPNEIEAVKILPTLAY